MDKSDVKTILIVDDEALIAMSEKMELEKRGYRVFLAFSGENALEEVRKNHSIELVLMDIDLGKRSDGTKIAEHLLEIRDIPIVFLSSHTDPAIVARTEGITSYGYVVKSSNITVLDASIKMAFKLFDAKRSLSRELHERKLAEEKATESEAFLNNVLESIQDGISVLSKDLKILKVNNVMKKWYEKNLPLEGKSCFQCYHDKVEPCSPCPTLRSLKSGRTEMEVVSGLSGSRVKWIELFSYPVKDPENGEVNAVVEFVRDITEKREAEEELARQLEEKELLLREVHHRIKNNIASIISLLSMQAGAVGENETSGVLLEAIGRINSMKLLYEKLLISETFMDVDVKEYLEDLIETVIALFPESQKIKITIDIDDFPFTSKKVFPLGIILNELLTNAMKHAFAQKTAGNIAVTLKKADEEINLTVRDDGRGIPDTIASNGCSSGGFGLTLADILSKQLGGSFSIAKEGGTVCRVVCPV